MVFPNLHPKEDSICMKFNSNLPENKTEFILFSNTNRAILLNIMTQ